MLLGRGPLLLLLLLLPFSTIGEWRSAARKAEPSAARASATAAMLANSKRRRPARSMARMPTIVPSALVSAGSIASSRAAWLPTPASCRMLGVKYLRQSMKKGWKVGMSQWALHQGSGLPAAERLRTQVSSTKDLQPQLQTQRQLERQTPCAHHRVDSRDLLQDLKQGVIVRELLGGWLRRSKATA